MSVFRLLHLSLLSTIGVASLTAQSSSEQTFAVIQYTDSWRSHFSADASSPNLQDHENHAQLMDRVRIDRHKQRSNRSTLQVLIDPDFEVQDNTLCYSMRTYKVARDDPQSDSMHRAGYSTCQPAMRFRTQTIEGVILP
jgi:hypothetical protein